MFTSEFNVESREETQPLPNIMICHNGYHFEAARKFIPNSWTFLYTNKYLITNLETLRIQKELAARRSKQN
jgi:hypothetical protein